MISNIGCTLPSILKQIICYTQSLNRQEITLSQIGFSLKSAKNTTLMTRSFSSMVRLHFSKPVANAISILDTNDMEIETVSNVSSVR